MWIILSSRHELHAQPLEWQGLRISRVTEPHKWRSATTQYKPIFYIYTTYRPMRFSHIYDWWIKCPRSCMSLPAYLPNSSAYTAHKYYRIYQNQNKGVVFWRNITMLLSNTKYKHANLSQQNQIPSIFCIINKSIFKLKI